MSTLYERLSSKHSFGMPSFAAVLVNTQSCIIAMYDRACTTAVSEPIVLAHWFLLVGILFRRWRQRSVLPQMQSTRRSKETREIAGAGKGVDGVPMQNYRAE